MGRKLRCVWRLIEGNVIKGTNGCRWRWVLDRWEVDSCSNQIFMKKCYLFFIKKEKSAFLKLNFFSFLCVKGRVNVMKFFFGLSERRTCACELNWWNWVASGSDWRSNVCNTRIRRHVNFSAELAQRIDKQLKKKTKLEENAFLYFFFGCLNKLRVQKKKNRHFYVTNDPKRENCVFKFTQANHVWSKWDFTFFLSRLDVRQTAYSRLWRVTNYTIFRV